jgi:hypothetical protein
MNLNESDASGGRVILACVDRVRSRVTRAHTAPQDSNTCTWTRGIEVLTQK